MTLARQRAGISVKEMALQIDRDRNTPARWESGRPNYDHAVKYATICGNVTAQWLLHEIGDWPTQNATNTPTDDGGGAGYSETSVTRGYQIVTARSPLELVPMDYDDMPAAA